MKLSIFIENLSYKQWNLKGRGKTIIADYCKSLFLNISFIVVKYL